MDNPNMEFLCYTDGNIDFVYCRSTSGVFMSEVLFHCSLKGNQLTDTGAIVLATALQHNKSLKELK